MRVYLMLRASLWLLLPHASSFAPVSSPPRFAGTRLQHSAPPSSRQVFTRDQNRKESFGDVSIETTERSGQSLNSFLSTLVVAGVLTTGNAGTAYAYKPNDYASDVVVTAVQSLKDSSGNIQQTFKNYENIGSIITEGRGVGGIINYKGIQLDRGYISDEDTTIYNPGLTLLTESEKERLVEAVIQSRKDNLNQGQWNDENQRAYDFLRDKLDPLHTTELRGYLAIFPFYTAAIYLAALAVQQFARDLFPAAYLVGVAAIVAPFLILVAAGPQ